MPSTPKEVGPYHLQQEIGRGGMGVVYRGEDSRLGRAVAIKALPAEFANDPARMNRFEREAKVLASLSHPNIAAVYGLEKRDGSAFLIMEFIEGESLAEMVERGALPVDEAITVCAQIAAAVETAHEAGVIHRDLKPGNVMVAPDGKVKVLDFGLAREIIPKASSMDVTASAASFATQDGMVLGTPGYMSPEQARGKQLDKRTDIFSFGCLLFECLTGKRTFPGETNADVMAAILERDPDWNAMPNRTPPNIRELVQRCLEKDARRRLRDIGDARLELQEAIDKRTWTTASLEAARGMGLPARRRLRTAGLVAAALVIGAASGMLLLNQWQGAAPSHSSGVVRLALTLDLDPPLRVEDLNIELSPDGQNLAYVVPAIVGAEGEAANGRIYVRLLSDFQPRLLKGTEGADSSAMGFSPDSRWLAYPIRVENTRNFKLMKVPVDGTAPPMTFATREGWIANMVWLTNDEVLLQTRVAETGSYGLERISVDGRSRTAMVDLKLPESFNRVSDYLTIWSGLPGGHAVLCLMNTSGGQSVWACDLDTGNLKRLVDGYAPKYASTGHLVYTRGGTILAAGFDPLRLEVTSGAVSLVSGLATIAPFDASWFTLSETGTLQYFPGKQLSFEQQLIMVDEKGAITPFVDELRWFSTVSVAQDGSIAAVALYTERQLGEIWVTDVAHPRLRRMLWRDGVSFAVPLPSDDGKLVACMLIESDQSNSIVVAPVDGSAEPRLVYNPGNKAEFAYPDEWMPGNEELILYVRKTGERFGKPMFVSAIADGDVTKYRPAFPNRPEVLFPRFSPDGRLLGYSIQVGDRLVAQLCTYDSGKLGAPITLPDQENGFVYNWSADSKTIYYGAFSADNRIVAVDVTTTPNLTVSDAREVIDLKSLGSVGVQTGVAMLPDNRLLTIRRPPTAESLPKHLFLVLNWFEELKAKMAAQEMSN